MQAVNVALGGSLHQHVHELPNRLDHREDKALPTAQQYAPTHTVRLHLGGLLRKLVGDDEVLVNSLHAQGVDRLADGLSIEATSPDGLVEAFAMPTMSSICSVCNGTRNGRSWIMRFIRPSFTASARPVEDTPPRNLMKQIQQWLEARQIREIKALSNVR